MEIGGYKTHDDFKNKIDFEAIYAKVVRKLLVYSIVSQISGEQDRLIVNQSAVMGYGGGEFSLECGAGFFSGRDRLEPGGIFSCWDREVERTENLAANLVAQDDEQIGAALVPARYSLGEITFSFDLYTVFGKTAEIYVCRTVRTRGTSFMRKSALGPRLAATGFKQCDA